MVIYNRFITLESVEGAGKSTLISKLATRLSEVGFDVVVTREPGGISIAEAIRSIILDKGNTQMDYKTEALLYAAARRQHLVEKIIPALERGAIVICDRFLHSSLAYQGYARGLGINEVYEMNRFAVEGCMPGLTIYLDLDPEIGLARIASDKFREQNRLDLEGLEFHRKVREGYLWLTKLDSRMVTINADKRPEQVANEAWEIVMDHLRYSCDT